MANRDRFDTGTDNPPHSRLFVIAGKGVKEEEYREAFSKYGEVEDVWIVKDRRTNEEKGITYIKFSRTSEAALAVEEMNGKTLGSNPKPIKVIIASSRKDGNVRDPREEEKLVRLFVVCPKKFTEDDLKAEFKQYGDIDYTQVVRDRSSGENKGFGYIKFHRPYHAAVALECCDPSFRPKFAEPKARKGDREERESEYERRYDRYDSGYSSKRMYPDPSPYEDFPMQVDDRSARGFSLGMPQTIVQQQMEQQMRTAAGLTPAEMLQSYPSSNCQRLHITAPLGMTQSYLSRLFNLIPGLEYCDLNEQTGIAYARYQSYQCAAYAHDKLDGFEYPIGSRLIVRYADAQPPADIASSSMKMPLPGMNPAMVGPQSTSPMAGGSGTFQRAAELLEQAGIDPGEVLACGVERVRYCSLMLPLPQPLRHEGTECRVRLFIVCQPNSIPEKVLRDAFCRFGNLIDVFLLGGRNYGYAKYADSASAQKAITTLHGQTLAGNRLKVLEADPPKEDNHRDRDRDHHRDSHRRDDRDSRREDMSGIEESPNKKQRT